MIGEGWVRKLLVHNILDIEIILSGSLLPIHAIKPKPYSVPVTVIILFVDIRFGNNTFSFKSDFAFCSIKSIFCTAIIKHATERVIFLFVCYRKFHKALKAYIIREKFSRFNPNLAYNFCDRWKDNYVKYSITVGFLFIYFKQNI